MIRPRFGQAALALGLCAVLSSSAVAAEPTFRDLVRKYLKTGDGNHLASKLGAKTGVEGVVALEYKVLHKTDAGETPIDPATHSFNIGDKIRIRIEPLSEMYVYIFHEGASGERVCLLPTEEEQAPLVKAGKTIDLPSDGYLEFAAPPGDEKLIVVATEKPIADLAGLSNVVFKKPNAALTPAEMEIKEKLKASGQKVLQSIKARNEQTAYRGLLSDEALAKVGAQAATRDVTLEEPPHGDQQSSFAMACSPKGSAKPQLMVNIPLKSKAKAK
jgi:hypothetical protein